MDNGLECGDKVVYVIGEKGEESGSGGERESRSGNI